MADDLSRRLASLRRPSDSRAQADAPSTSSIGETDPFNEPRARAGSQGTVAGRNTARGDDDEADALTDTESSRSSAAECVRRQSSVCAVTKPMRVQLAGTPGRPRASGPQGSSRARKHGSYLGQEHRHAEGARQFPPALFVLTPRSSHLPCSSTCLHRSSERMPLRLGQVRALGMVAPLVLASSTPSRRLRCRSWDHHRRHATATRRTR